MFEYNISAHYLTQNVELYIRINGIKFYPHYNDAICSIIYGYKNKNKNKIFELLSISKLR